MYIKVNGVQYPAKISWMTRDPAWDWRESRSVTVEMTHAEAAALFVDGLSWSEVTPPVSYINATGEPVTVPERETDRSDYCVAGIITDHRDGKVTVKMGKKTDGEMLAELLEVLNSEKT